MNFKSVVLCILDGWGNGIKNSKYNAINNANPPYWQYIRSHYQKCSLSACGIDVGLPDGQIGNSEVGHMNIDSGRVVMQSLQRINQEIETIKYNVYLHNFINDLKSKNSICHIMGLISNGGVHSHQKHISVLANKISKCGIKVVIHVFLVAETHCQIQEKLHSRIYKKSIKKNDIMSLGVTTLWTVIIGGKERLKLTMLSHLQRHLVMMMQYRLLMKTIKII